MDNKMLNEKERIFIAETLKALFNGARIGKCHYSVTISRLDLVNLIGKIHHKESNNG